VCTVSGLSGLIQCSFIFPFANPEQKLRSAGSKRRSGGLFFGYFLLAMQKKVTRLSVREPTLKQLRNAKLYQFLK
jgi:hypothetical protein